MTIEQALLTDIFQEQDSRSTERNLLTEILDKDNRPEKLYIV